MFQDKPNTALQEARLQIHLFGTPRIILGGGVLVGLKSAKGRALLFYLAATGRVYTRPALAGLFWGEMPEAEARTNLRKAIQQLRVHVGDFLVSDRETVALSCSTDCWIDAAAFDRILDQAKALDQPFMIQEALDLYSGDFLEGFYLNNAPAFESWYLSERARLRERLLNSLMILADAHAQIGELGEAIALMRRYLSVEPWREDAHRRLMLLLAQDGQRGAALMQYETCRRLLADELNTIPSGVTTALFERIQTNNLEPLPQPDTAAPIKPPNHNLPLHLTSFIGRTRELAEIIELVAQHRLVTLTGVGGTGKTRLALRVAEDLLVHFPDGVWLAELAELADPELVPRSLSAALGLQESSHQTSLEQLKAYLEKKKLLIVLDNCEHLIADCARVVEALLLSCPDIKILTSSREALSVSGEVTYHVPSLPVPDQTDLPSVDQILSYPAARLFAERAVLVEPKFTVTSDNVLAVAQICWRLSGIPLSIELAAARVSSLSVAQIAARLDDRLRLLTGGSRTAVPRQQTLRASIDWSYSLLMDNERLLLTRLSVFQGGWTLELAVEVCASNGLDEFDVLDGLAQLVNKSLIMAETGPDGDTRYRQLETIRQYAREKLLESEDSNIMHDRHLEAFCNLAERSEPNLRGPQQVEWLDQLERELGNLRAALEWALDKDPARGLRLATSLYWLWHLRGFRVEGGNWLQQMQDQAGNALANVDQALLAEALARQVLLLTISGQAGEQVTRKAEESLAIAKGLGDDGKRVVFLAVQALAWSAWALGESANNHKFNQQLLTIAEENGDRFQIAEALRQLALTEQDRSKAKAYAERNLALRRELGDLDGLASSYQSMGNVYIGSGELTQALQMYEQSIQLARKIKNRSTTILWSFRIGRVYLLSGELDKAIETFMQGMTEVQNLGELAWIIRQYNALGCCFGMQQDWSQAEEYFQQAIGIAIQNQFALWEAISYTNLAEVAWSLGDNDLAGKYYLKAAAISQDHDDLSLVGLGAYASGKAALLDRDLDCAEGFFKTALRDYANRGYVNETGPCIESLAVCAVQLGHFERAVHLHGIVASRNWLKDPWFMPWLISYDLDELLGSAQAGLGERRCAQLFASGQAKSLEEAMAYALEEDNSPNSDVKIP